MQVRLVIEFCDRGCLRSALDGNAFFCPTGLNYPAILDTAADVARALTHLHANNVLHGERASSDAATTCDPLAYCLS